MRKAFQLNKISLVFVLLLSLLLCGCPATESSAVSKPVNTSSDTAETEHTNTEQTTSSSYERAKSSPQYELSVQVLSSKDGGDSTILRYGNTEILIDTSLGTTTKEAVLKVMEDDVDQTWEYVIFTHPDNDHIGKAKELFDTFKENNWQVKRIIDFGIENVSEQENTEEKEVLSEYKKQIRDLKNVEYYTPNGNLSKEQLTKEYEIDQNFKLTILYNENCTSKSDNEKSVCCLFQLDNQKLLFTGDLERLGEAKLIENHRELLKNVTFFKAGHHGSNTSNTQKFIDWIRPAYVAITFNHKRVEEEFYDSISKFLKYTDYIFPTVVKDNAAEQKPVELFGECHFVLDGTQVKVISKQEEKCTIKQALLGEENWYLPLVHVGKITDEINAYFFDENIFVDSKTGIKATEDKNGNISNYNCTLVKYGHFDILIDCGSVDDNSTMFADKLKDYVVDGIIEYVIVSHFHIQNYSQLVGEATYDDKCIFGQFRIENVIYNDSSMTNSNDTAGTLYSLYLAKVSTADKIQTLKHDSQPISFSIGDDGNVKLTIFRGNNTKNQKNEDDYSLVSVIEYYGKRMVFVGDLTSYDWFNDNYGKMIENTCLLRYPCSYCEYKKMEGLDKFLNISKPDVIIIGSPINHWNNNQYYIKGDSISGLVNYLINSAAKRTLKVYSCGYVDNNENKSVSGDIDFMMYLNPDLEKNDLNTSFYVSCCFNGGKGNKSKIGNSYYEYVPDSIQDYPAVK